jgi:hypothetical protein
MTNYPDTCIKGIPNHSFVGPNGFPSTHLFYFDPPHAREDGWIEESINWEDDEQAIDFTLNQKKDDGTLQFKAGVALIPRGEIDRLNSQPSIANSLGYERAPLDGNPYHGNLLLQEAVPKAIMKKIAAGIALCVSEVIQQGHE